MGREDHHEGKGAGEGVREGPVIPLASLDGHNGDAPDGGE